MIFIKDAFPSKRIRESKTIIKNVLHNNTFNIYLFNGNNFKKNQFHHFIYLFIIAVTYKNIILLNYFNFLDMLGIELATTNEKFHYSSTRQQR
jgi:hypothetical protein